MREANTMDFYIFRHGETYYTKNKLHYGNAKETAEILPESIPIIKKQAKFLKKVKTSLNFSSPYTRCKQTVSIIEDVTGKKFEFDERIGEERMDLGETIDDMHKRIASFYNSLKADNKPALVCSHGWPIAILWALITKGEFSVEDLDNHPRPGEIWIYKNGKIEMPDFNF
jgi:broad specificity phosphatase PhoE